MMSPFDGAVTSTAAIPAPMKAISPKAKPMIFFSSRAWGNNQATTTGTHGMDRNNVLGRLAIVSEVCRRLHSPACTKPTYSAGGGQVDQRGLRRIDEGVPVLEARL